MTDFQAPSLLDASGQSQLAAPSQVAAAPQLDVSSVDQTIRTINSIERAWRLPALPEEVKLDLSVVPGVTKEIVSDLLWGLDSDLAGEEEVEQEDPTANLVIDWDNEQTAMDRFRLLLNQWRGELPPTEVTVDAVRKFKLEAIRRGRLEPPADGRIDSTWSPELNRIQRDMLFEDIDSIHAGNRAGAVSTNKVLETLAKWTSPTGLLSAATQLDLFWDFGAISREFSSWGDKWRKVGESSGPLDFAKNLIDAVTGPIDDIVLPAANVLLLGTGVGAMANLGRIGVTAGRLGAARRMMGSIYSAARLVPTPLGRAGGMATASLTSGLLSRSSIGAIRGAGSAMQAWRDFTAVQRVKQGVQLGMRAGFISQAEDLLPGYQGGWDMAHIDRVEEYRQKAKDFGLTSPLASVAELAFAPQNIFNPGAFTNIGRAGVGFLAAGGTIPGRAAVGAVAGAAGGALFGDEDDVFKGMAFGSLGAVALPIAARGVQQLQAARRLRGVAVVVDDVDNITTGVFDAATGLSTVPAKSGWAQLGDRVDKYVGWVTDGIAHLDFKPLAEDQRIGNAFHKGIRRFLETDERELQRWDDLFTKHNSFKGAFQEFYGLDEDSTNAAMAFVALSAAIDHTAAIQSGGRQGDDFLRFKTKLVSQIQVFDLDDPALMEKVARAMAVDQIGQKGHVKRYQDILSKLTPESARREAEMHNRLAQVTLRQLTSLDNIEDILDAGADAFAMGAMDGPRVGLEQTIGAWRQTNADERVSALEAYVAGVAGTFGDWDRFSKHTLTIDNWVNSGLLDDAEFVGVLNPTTGKMRQPRAEIYKVDRKLMETSSNIVDERLANPQAAVKTRKSVAPLAAAQPTGRFAMARSSTVTKQTWEEVQIRLRDTINAYENLQHLRQTGGLQRVISQIEKSGRSFDDMSVRELKQWLKAAVESTATTTKKGGVKPGSARLLGLARGDRSRLTSLKHFMERYGFSSADFDVAINQRLEELAQSPFVGMGDEFLENLAAKTAWTDHGFDAHVLKLDEKTNTRRAVSGLEALKERYKQVAEKARRTAAEVDVDKLLRSVEQKHGTEVAVEFREQIEQFKRDGYKLVHGVEFLLPTDLVKAPIFADHGVREMHMATFGNFFGRRQPAVARMIQERRERAVLADVLDVSVDDAKIDSAWKHLRMILEEIQQPVIDAVENRPNMTLGQKLANSLQSGATPVMVTDLTRHQKTVVARLHELGWSEREAQQIFSGIRRFRNAEFRDVGLYALEAKLRQKNLNVSALKWLTGAEDGPGHLRMAAGAAVGGAVAADLAEDGQVNLDGNLLAGAAIGAGAALGGRLAANRFMDVPESLLRAEQRAGWMLGDKFARLRDNLRFTLSPFFEVSRYTEGVMLSSVGTPLRDADGNRLVLPRDLSPRGVKKRLGADKWQDARKEFSQLLRTGGHGDIDVADDMIQRFSQVGIFGFNPQHWQVAAFAEMRHAGVGAKEAFEHAVETFTYGVRGRSAAELSVNAIFFPFSFQKKTLTHVAKWVADDLARSILIHDALKVYEVLDEKYDLNEKFADHIPALDMLERLNVFAYGVSPGRFGGINAQAIETFGKMALLFTPIGVQIRNDEDGIEIDRLLRSLTPAWNDINWMLEEAKESTGLIHGGQLRRAQVREGFNAWNQLREEVSAELSRAGYTWYDLHNRPYLAEQKAAYEAAVADIQRRYPQWTEYRRGTMFNSRALQMEREDRLRRIEAFPEEADALDEAFAAMEFRLEEIKQHLSMVNISVDGPDGWSDAPPEVFDAVREYAVFLYQQNPLFLKIYNKFYAPQFGMIEAPIGS